MGNNHSSDGLPPPGERRAKGTTLLTSTEEIESWMPDSMEKMKKMKPGTVLVERVEDWDDENVVMKATQVCARVNVFFGLFDCWRQRVFVLYLRVSLRVR